MITLTNGQASAFNSPAINSLFNDTKRQFPTDDAFRLSDLVQQIHEKLKLYNEQLKKIIENFEGEIQPTGQVIYKDPNSQLKAQVEVEKLNAVTIEITGTIIKRKKDWPKLSLAEATILRPLIKNENRGKK